MKIKAIREVIEKNLNNERAYSNSFGSGSTKIGSLGVVTINLPRIAYKNQGNEDLFLEELRNFVCDAAKINHAKRNVVRKRIDNGNLPLYTLGFIDLKKQYSTCGIIGLNEAIEIMGYNLLEKDGQEFALKILNVINETNSKFEQQFGFPHNCEQIPGESSAVKLAQKDKLLKYQTDDYEYELYSNQFVPLITNADLLDRIKIQGLFDKHFSGGSIAHLNVDTEITDVRKMEKLISLAAKKGVIYFAVNYNLQLCANGHMSVGKNSKCSCGADITEEFTRIVGYLVRVKAFNKTRREIDYPNRKFYSDIDIKEENNIEEYFQKVA